MKKEKFKHIGGVAHIHTHGNLEKNRNGITLIALIVTIIVLLILAGVAISSLTESGLFRNVKLAKEKSEQASLIEELELEITSIRMDKMAQGKSMQIEDLLKLNNSKFQVEPIDEFTVRITTDKYEFEIDSNFKVKYTGPVSGIRVSYTLSTTNWTNENITITITATTTEGTIETISTPEGLTKNEDGTYTASANGTYKFVVTDSNGNEKEREVIINKIDKIVPPDFTPTISNITTKGFTITANAQDNVGGSGIASYEYHVGNKTYTSTEGTKIVNDLDSGTEYTVYVIATDRVGYSKQSSNITESTSDGRLDYAIITASGIYNCIDDNGNYFLDTSVNPKNPSALPVTCYDGNASSSGSLSSTAFTGRLNVDSSAWGKRIEFSGLIGYVCLGVSPLTSGSSVGEEEVSSSSPWEWEDTLWWSFSGQSSGYLVVPSGCTFICFSNGTSHSGASLGEVVVVE